MFERMKTFTEQLQEAVGATYPLEDILQNLTPEQILEEVNIFARSLAKEALKNASENATLNKETQYTGGLGITGLLYEESLVIDKQSILNESNIPTL